MTVALAVPVVAMAAIVGDSLENAAPVTIPFSDANSLIAGPAPDDGYVYWYVVPLTVGQTIEMTSTAAASIDALSLIMSAAVLDPMFVASDYVSPNIDRLRYMAPRSGEYFIGVFGSTPGTFTVNAVTIPAVRFSLRATVMPKTARPRRSFTTSAKLVPGYNSSTVPVRFYVQRKLNGRWRYYTSKTTRLSASAATYSKFSAKFKLPRGTFRIRARFRDAAHTTARYNAYKTIYVRY